MTDTVCVAARVPSQWLSNETIAMTSVPSKLLSNETMAMT